MRNFDNPTYGSRMGTIARLLGKPYMPWQQYVADVLGEVDPRTGLRVYREGLVTLMRQQGKTTFVVSAKVHRALDCAEPQLMLFAAQDGVEAKKKWLQHADLIKRTPLRARLAGPDEPTTSNGKELLTWDTGSTEAPITSRPSSGHGDTLDLGLVTEAFSQVDDRYEQTMLPAMLARPDAQFLAESTAGTAESLYWNERIGVERTRMELEPDRPSRVAVFDWSFGPDDDPGAVDTWARRIPALGLTIRLDEIQHAYDTATTPKKMAAFLRGFGNVTDMGAYEVASVFPGDDWDDTGSDKWSIVGARAFALDITNDQSWASIGQAGPNETGGMQLEVVAHDRGRHWVIPALVELFDRNPRAPRRVYVVAGGQAALMAEDIEKKDIEVIILDRADHAAGCARVYDEITEHNLTHRATGQAPLDAAVGGAAWTTRGDARVWDRAKSTSIIAPLVAVTAARWGYELEASVVTNVLETIG